MSNCITALAAVADDTVAYSDVAGSIYIVKVVEPAIQQIEADSTTGASKSADAFDFLAKIEKVREGHSSQGEFRAKVISFNLGGKIVSDIVPFAGRKKSSKCLLVFGGSDVASFDFVKGTIGKLVHITNNDELITSAVCLDTGKTKALKDCFLVATDGLVMHVVNVKTGKILYALKELMKTKSDSIVATVLIPSLCNRNDIFVAVAVNTALFVVKLRGGQKPSSPEKGIAAKTWIVSMSKNFGADITAVNMIGKELYIGFSDGSIASYVDPQRLKSEPERSAVYADADGIACLEQVDDDLYMVCSEEGQVVVVGRNAQTSFAGEGLLDSAASTTIYHAGVSIVASASLRRFKMVIILPLLSAELVYLTTMSNSSAACKMIRDERS